MTPTRITEIQWRHYCIPFLNGFTTAHGVMTAREGIIVQITTEQGISGIGEIAPLPAFTEETLADADSLLPTLAAHLRGMTLEEALDLILAEGKAGITDTAGQSPTTVYLGNLGRGDRSPSSSQAHLNAIRLPCNQVGERSRSSADDKDSPTVSITDGSASTLCGLEIALLDALGKAEGRPVCALLSPAGHVPRATVPVNAVIGARSTEKATAAAKEAVGNGFRCVKLKVGLLQSPQTGPEKAIPSSRVQAMRGYQGNSTKSSENAPGDSIQAEVERVAAVREAIGPAIHLRLDANEAWHLEEAIAVLSRCVPYAIQYVEQPLKAHNLAGMRTLRQAVPMPIAADEALHGPASVRLILDNEAADILVIKPQLAGGLRAAQQMIQVAAERGVRSVITSTIESGIGVAATLHLAAASPAVTLECGLATLHLLSDDLLVNDLPVSDGLMAVPTGPGLGVELDWKALHEWSLK